MKIAIIGLGAMGAPTAENLLKAGHEVITAIHRNSEAACRLQTAYGLKIAENNAKAVEGADAIITFLPTDKEVREVLINEKLADAIDKNAVVIEMSSCTTEAMKAVADFYKERGICVLDAPVSGGVNGARQGTMTVFGAGEEEAFRRAEPVLDVIASKVYHLGECGTGKTIKNMDNILSMYNLMGICEAYRIVKKNGIDPDMFYEVIGANSGGSTSFKNRWPRLMKDDFEPGFYLKLGRKDVKNALALGDGMALPMFSQLYQMMCAAKPYDNEDVNALRKLFEEESGQ